MSRTTRRLGGTLLVTARGEMAAWKAESARHCRRIARQRLIAGLWLAAEDAEVADPWGSPGDGFCVADTRKIYRDRANRPITWR